MPRLLRRPDAPVDPALEAAAERALEHVRGRAANRYAPPQAGAIAARILKPILPARLSMTLDDLKRRWPEIVGEKLAPMTAPEKLSRGSGGARSLTIAVSGPAAPFVQHQIPLILERCNLAGADLAGIQIKQGVVRRPTMTNVRRLPGPLAADAEQCLANDLEGISDPSLRAALLKLGRAVRR